MGRPDTYPVMAQSHHSTLSDFDDEPTDVRDTLATLASRALVVDEATPLDEVRRMLLERRVPAIVVADPYGNVRGVITRTDLLRAIDDDATAADAMSGFVFALPVRSSVEKAAALMAYEGVGQIVVTGDHGQLVGMVSALDIAHHVAVVAGYLVQS
jgi:CBS domain-containing protein